MMNMRFGNKRLKVEKTVQIYGACGTGKTVAALKYLKQWKDKEDFSLLSISWPEFQEKLTPSEMVERIASMENFIEETDKSVILFVDNVDFFEESAKDNLHTSSLVWNLINRAIDSEKVNAVVLVSQHIHPEFMRYNPIIIQTARMYKENVHESNEYIEVLQMPVTSYPINNVTIADSAVVRELYEFGYNTPVIKIC